MKESIGKKEDLRLRRTYRLLTDALMSLMEVKPFEDIRVNDICERAMVHRTTFYKHFEDKYHLLTYCIQAFQVDFCESCLTDESIDNPKQYYMSILLHVLSYFSENRKMILLVINERGGDTIMKMFHELVVRDVTTKLEEGEKRGIQYQIPISVILEYHVGALIALARWWLVKDMPVSANEVVRYVDLMINESAFIVSPIEG